MWRSAVVRFGMLASIAMLGCGGGTRSGSGGDETLSNRALAQGDRDLSASYWCSIRSGDYEYPAMPCVVRRENDEFVLAKLAGSQRFRGVVRERAGGLTFDGEFYCPWGDCTQPLHGVFTPTADGRLVGTFDDKGIIVTMTRVSDDRAFGRNGYGGAAYGGYGYGYGGVGYGGVGYGGASYGGNGYGGNVLPAPRH